MKRYEFVLRISASQYLEYYRGAVRHVVARCRTGQTIQFPASLLQKFVTPTGVNGTFALTCNDQHKDLDLQKIDTGVA